MSLIDWIAVEVDLPDHPKVAELAARLNEPLAEAYIIRIWAWAGRIAHDGIVRGHSAECPGNGAETAGRILETAARWRGEPGALAAALVRVGLLDPVTNGLQIHDWMSHAGKFIKKAKAERDRKRRGRGAERPRNVRGRGADAARNVRAEKEKEKDKEEKEDPAGAVAPLVEQQPLALGPLPKKPKPERKPPNGRHAATIALWCRRWDELRGGGKYVVRAKDGKAVASLLKLADATDEEIDRRIRAAFAKDWFRSGGDLCVFVSKWSTWSAPQAQLTSESNGCRLISTPEDFASLYPDAHDAVAGPVITLAPKEQGNGR